MKSGFGVQPVEGVDPVSLQIIDQKHNAAAGPGDGICPGNGFQLIEIRNRQGDVGDTKNTPEAQHGEHGDGGFSGAPEDTRDTVGKGKQTVE